MGWFSKKEASVSGENYDFSTPFTTMEKGNLSLPFIAENGAGRQGMVYFGTGNIYPNELDQLYYTSPLHGSICDFKVNATIGGGYRVKPKSEEIKLLTKIEVFKNMLNFDETIERMALADILHYRYYFELRLEKQNNGAMLPVEIKFLEPSKVRKDYSGKWAYIAEDWTTQRGFRQRRFYDPNCKDEIQILAFETKTTGQDVYPLPRYTSANNWIFMDGEESYLQKTNIVESIFPSFALLFPRKPANKEEKESIKKTIEGAKGAQKAGRIFALFANKKDEIPEVTPIPKNNNDSLFENTSPRIDNKICQAHCIDPLLMGIRVGGMLGSGTDIEKAYTIFEKNDILKRRRRLEKNIKVLFRLFGIQADFEVNAFQIINETVYTEGEDNTAEKMLSQIAKLPQAAQAEAMKALTPNEFRILLGLRPVIDGNRIAVLKQEQNQNFAQ